MGTVGLIFASALACVAAFLAGAASRRADGDRPPPPARRGTSLFVERVEAPGSRPIRVCGRRSCRRPIVKVKDGDEMVVRIEGESILYLHGECADATGEPLP